MVILLRFLLILHLWDIFFLGLVENQYYFVSEQFPWREKKVFSVNRPPHVAAKKKWNVLMFFFLFLSLYFSFFFFSFLAYQDSVNIVSDTVLTESFHADIWWTRLGCRRTGITRNKLCLIGSKSKGAGCKRSKERQKITSVYFLYITEEHPDIACPYFYFCFHK